MPTLLVEFQQCVYYNSYRRITQDLNSSTGRIYGQICKSYYKKPEKIILLFIIISIISVVLTLFVDVNYNMADYLPQKAVSTTGIKVMNREFTQAIPNVSVMVENVSIIESLDIKRQLFEVEGISEVLWLDDVADLKMPLAMQDNETVEGFYKDQSALFSVTIKDGAESDAIAAIRKIIGSGGSIAGEAANLNDMKKAAVAEVGLAVTILLPVIIIILILSTTSWMEPILFLSALVCSHQ